MPGKPTEIYGQVIAPCRVTPRGLWVAVRRVALPLIAAFVLIDLVIWAAARAFGLCYGVWCWF